MRKLLLLVFVTAFVFQACEQEIEIGDSDLTDLVLTRDKGGWTDPVPIPDNVIASGETKNLEDPLKQITGIPVWIYLPDGVAATEAMYLSAYPELPMYFQYGNIELSSDKNHTRTKWILDYKERVTSASRGTKELIYSFKTLYTGLAAGKIVFPAGSAGGTAITAKYKYNATDTESYVIRLLPSPLEDRYIIGSAAHFGNASAYTGTPLRCIGFNSKIVQLIPSLPNDYYCYWHITPVEDFELIDIKYDFVAGNRFASKPLVLK